MKKCPVCNHCGNCIKRKPAVIQFPITKKEKGDCDLCAMPLDVVYDCTDNNCEEGILCYRHALE